MRFSDPSEMPRARRTPARTAPTERAAPKATADGTVLPLFTNRRERAADGNRTSTEKETKRICIGTSLTIKKGALRLLAVLSGSRTDSARSATLLRGRKESSERSAALLRGNKESSETPARLLRGDKGSSETSAVLLRGNKGASETSAELMRGNKRSSERPADKIMSNKRNKQAELWQTRI